MDALFRRRRPLLALALCAAPSVWLACAPRGSMGPVGQSSAPRGMSTAKSPDASVALEAGLSPAWRESFAPIGRGRFPSLGHAAGRWDAVVWANAAARETLDAADASLPVGAAFVQEHFEREGDGGAGPVMLMEKREAGFDPAHGDLRWVVVTASGETVQDGPSASCSGCHDDAPRDRYFPIK